MPRPILDERMTIRLPGALLTDCLDAAARRNCSLNDVVLGALENEFARIVAYRADYYRDLRPFILRQQADIARECQTMKDDR